MLYRINNLKMSLDADTSEVFAEAFRRAKLSSSDILSKKIIKKSIDARRGEVLFVYSVLLKTNSSVFCDGTNILQVKNLETTPEKQGTETLKERPVIVGFGPCGMFSALTLARNGFKPLVIERGASVLERTEKVNTFWHGGDFDENTNVQFGEGGAGTFSDGKLTTRIGDPLSDSVLEDFVKFGAPEDILYNAMPHVGTDILKDVVKNIRAEIISLGGEIRFNTKLSDVSIKNGKVNSITLSSGETIPCSVLILGIGHSARDTYKMLFEKGVNMIQKPFSVGFRIEHLQEDINRAMYGKYANHPALGAATYKLSYREGDKGCYSFCMCPGGSVVLASSEKDSVVVNGMSERARDKINSNSAICVNVSGDDFKDSHPLSGIEFQRELERKAFLMGGKDYSAPVQLLGDYLEGKVSKKFGKVKPSVLPNTEFTDLNNLFAPQFNSFMKKGILSFERKIKGFTNPETLLTGVETRTSAPLRIVRNEEGESVNVKGIYPAGEGAGYAGGIMSAAVDGIKTANKICEKYKPF